MASYSQFIHCNASTTCYVWILSMRMQGLVGYKSISNHIQRDYLALILLHLHIKCELCVPPSYALKRDVSLATVEHLIAHSFWNFHEIFVDNKVNFQLSNVCHFLQDFGSDGVCVCCLYALWVNVHAHEAITNDVITINTREGRPIKPYSDFKTKFNVRKHSGAVGRYVDSLHLGK